MGYYVYAHKLPDGTPFYIGKGKGKRITSRSGRSLLWKATVKKHYGNEFPKFSVLLDGLTESESLMEEVKLIKQYGRKDSRSGILVNMTDGGDGTSGHKHSTKTKQKMRNVRLGMNFSDEHKHNLSIATRRWAATNKIKSIDKVNKMATARRKFRVATLKNVNTGAIETVTEVSNFATKYGLHQGHVSDVINGHRYSHKQWILLERKL